MDPMNSQPQFLDLIETLSQFDSKILEVTKVVESSYQVFEELKKEWNLAAFELRENLAKSSSLRKKDFDFLVQGVFDFQEKREKEIRDKLYQYLDDQKEFSQSLKKLLIQAEKHRENQNSEGVQEEATTFLKLRQDFETKEKAFKRSLEEFKKEQKFIAQTLHNFLKDPNITSKSFKDTITNLLKSLTNEKDEREESLIFVKAA